MSFSNQHKYDEVCVDPALLSSSRDSVYVSPVTENIPSHQPLWETPFDTSLYLPDCPRPNHDNPTFTDTKTASPTSAKGHRRRPSRTSYGKKKADVDVVDLPAHTRSEDDEMCKLSARERNRIAACRSRLKKSKNIKHLEEEERLMSIKHECLSAYVAGLQGEVFELENMLLAHRDCDCVVIQKYFKARKAGLGQKQDIGPWRSLKYLSERA
ncbi:hypothetical protein F5883DRAFT_526679 [Diaporthe sp. PMI_573]|nr:hypothetical protein F5883DRAFT_526679 [Diaporthaceae sp. PMI_573]